MNFTTKIVFNSSMKYYIVSISFETDVQYIYCIWDVVLKSKKLNCVVSNLLKIILDLKNIHSL